jgi:hypothetical protein
MLWSFVPKGFVIFVIAAGLALFFPPEAEALSSLWTRKSQGPEELP